MGDGHTGGCTGFPRGHEQSPTAIIRRTEVVDRRTVTRCAEDWRPLDIDVGAGHSGVVGNDAADRMAARTGWIGID